LFLFLQSSLMPLTDAQPHGEVRPLSFIDVSNLSLGSACCSRRCVSAADPSPSSNSLGSSAVSKAASEGTRPSVIFLVTLCSSCGSSLCSAAPAC
jgi:hypothetical protein